METNEFRSKSLEVLAAAGMSLPKSLPLLDDFQVRSLTEIVDRIICLNAVASAAHGLNKDKALTWLLQEGMSGSLTKDEHLFLHKGIGNSDTFKIKVESMWALAWVVNMIPTLDFWKHCESSFVMILPDIKKSESTAELRNRAVLRSKDDIGFQSDLAYCLTWLIRETEMRHSQEQIGVTPYVVTERRRALDWVTYHSEWDLILLDT